MGSKPACNGTHELSELRSRDRGFLTYFVPFEPSDFGLVHAPLSSLFRFFLYGEMGGGLEGFIFFDIDCLHNQYTVLNGDIEEEAG